MKENAVKGLLTAAVGCMLAYLKELLIPVAVLGAMMALDYCTGIMKAWMTGTLSSRTGVRGILKKLGYLAVVVIGMAVDWVIRRGLTAVGVTAEFDFLFALILIIWLIINECISILENVSASGVPVPKFLFKITERLKNTVEEKGENLNVNN